MKTVPISQARANIFKLVEDTNQTHQPILISWKGGNAVLVSEEDWNAIQETLYLNSIPGMAESLLEGANTPIEDCTSLAEVLEEMENE